MKALKTWEGYGKQRVYLNDLKTGKIVKFFAEYEDGEYKTEDFKFNNYQDRSSQIGSLYLDEASEMFTSIMIETFGKDYEKLSFDEIKEKLGE